MADKGPLPNRARNNRKDSEKNPQKAMSPHFQRSDQRRVNNVDVFADSIDDSSRRSFVVKAQEEAHTQCFVKYAWEVFFALWIDEIRQKELDQMRKRAKIAVFMSLTWSVSPFSSPSLLLPLMSLET